MKFLDNKLITFKEKTDGAVLSLRSLVIISICLFAVGIISGFFLTPDSFGSMSVDINSLKQLAQVLRPFQVSTFIFIFLKNVLALVVSLVLSPLLCLIPIATLLLNGWLISFITLPIVKSGSAALVIVGILPHGLFEVPAFIFGEAIALGFGLAVLSMLKKRNWSKLGIVFRQSLRYFVIVILLLIPAALIETYITPLLIARFV